MAEQVMYEKTLGSRRIYDGRILALDVLDIEMPNGVRSMREVIRHRGAVAVLARCVDGRYVFVRQYRKAADGVFLEVVAGLREEGEAAELCARRELREESGYHAETVHSLGVIYPSPGYTDEEIELFYAQLAEEPGTVKPDEDEHLETVHLTAGEVQGMINKGEITDAKTLSAWLLGRAFEAGVSS
jgi:ADP-ribose pyrophosphatase